MKQVRLIQKHYNTILKQGFDNLPYETGGFLGGRDGTVCAILPTFNKDWDVNKDVYTLEQEDLNRAFAFFKKHDCKYFGVYHTHPKGIAYPSKEDINTGQKFHFIISYIDEKNPEFRAYKIENMSPIEIPLLVIPNTGYSSVDKVTGKKKSQNKPETDSDLDERIHNIIHDKPNTYKKKPPKTDFDNSDFSTFA